MSDLTLPGTIPGLLRFGSPVRHASDSPRIGMVVGTAPTFTRVYWCWSGTDDDEADVHLDLTDATGRAHAAWWLAAQHGEPSPTTEVWDFCPETTSRDVRDAEGNHLDLIDGGPALWMCGANGWTAGDAPLADLDPNDTRLLPDGSRWVDAEALRRVCLYVAGLS